MEVNSPKKIYLASPRGFCAGVKRAVSVLELVLKKHKIPVYVSHQIVHNRHVIDSFKKRGAVFVDDIEDVPNYSVVVLSAHGSSPRIYQRAKEKGLIVYDATCPLVAKVHQEAKRYAQEGYLIFYIGHKNHPEVRGVLDEIPKDSVRLIESTKDAGSVVVSNIKIVLLTQTTLSLDDTQTIIDILKKRFPSLIFPPRSDICFSTENRQSAVKQLAKKADVIVVVGSKESSNSNRLREVAEKNGARAYLINDKSEINLDWFKDIENIGITAGASTPENIIKDVIDSIKKDKTKIEELKVVEEKITFPLPQNIK